MIGRFDKGQVTIKDPNPNDGTGPIVTGAEAAQSISDKTTRYSGTNIRFRIIGGSFTVTVFGDGHRPLRGRPGNGHAQRLDREGRTTTTRRTR